MDIRYEGESDEPNLVTEMLTQIGVSNIGIKYFARLAYSDT